MQADRRFHCSLCTRFFLNKDHLVQHYEKAHKRARPIVCETATFPCPQCPFKGSKRKITLKHYKYRSPEQIKCRMTTRQQALEGGLIDSDHWKGDWEQKLVTDYGELRLHEAGEDFIIDSDQHPPHLDPPARHLLKRLLHSLKIWP